jgi:hypothetical protein
MSDGDYAPDGAQRLRDHADGCPECQASPLPLATIQHVLNSASVQVDVGQLSARAMAHVRFALERNAQRAMWRRAVRAVGMALLPLPVVTAYAVIVLWGVYSLAATLLPPALAAYLVGTYAAALTLMAAVTYAAIPVWLATRSREAAPIGR